MKTIMVHNKSSVIEKDLKLTVPTSSQFDTLISEPHTIIDDAGTPVVAYQHIEESTEDLLTACKNIKYQYADRSSGMMSQSRVLGFQPRIGFRRDFCSRSSMARDYPASHDIFLQWAAKASRLYKSVNPINYQQQASQLEAVRSEWRITDSVFTSGIVNKDNNLRYHYDAGNFQGVWSCMLVLQRDMQDGYLVVPKYGIAFTFSQPSIFMFDGQSLLHGVLPMRRKSSLGYRYSIVYYALKQMCKCLSPQEEIERIRVIKTQREVKRAKH
jgi:hypothetical protein